jgi:hypothetical protein
LIKWNTIWDRKYKIKRFLLSNFPLKR